MSEHAEQAALFRWAAFQQSAIPELRMLAAVPNGGHRHPIVAAKIKAEGVKAGYPDILLDVPRHGFHGLRIELKTAKGKLSRAQTEWLDALTQQGYMAVMCRGWEAARETILGYLGGEIGT